MPRKCGDLTLECESQSGGDHHWYHRGSGGWRFEYRESRDLWADIADASVRVLDGQGQAAEDRAVPGEDEAGQVFASYGEHW